MTLQEVAAVRWAGGRGMDREHEHGFGRQQEAVSDERRDHSDEQLGELGAFRVRFSFGRVLLNLRIALADDSDLRAGRFGAGVAGHRVAMRHDLHRASRARLATSQGKMVSCGSFVSPLSLLLCRRCFYVDFSFFYIECTSQDLFMLTSIHLQRPSLEREEICKRSRYQVLCFSGFLLQHTARGD